MTTGPPEVTRIRWRVHTLKLGEKTEYGNLGCLAQHVASALMRSTGSALHPTWDITDGVVQLFGCVRICAAGVGVLK